jgi:hypothetical protein
MEYINHIRDLMFGKFLLKYNLRIMFLLSFTFLIFTYTNAQSQLQSLESVTSHGITWEFEESAQVGQFVNGDYYVVGTVTIISISPTPENGRNGSVLNLPPDQNRSGFDDRVSSGRYDANLRAEVPISMVPGDALISSISVETLGELPAPFRPSDASISPVQSVSVLTCLEEEVSADAFRPSYSDPDKIIYYANNLRRDLLTQLQRVGSTPDIELFADHFQRPWLEVCYFGFDAAIEYQPNYGREVGRAVGMASLLLLLDFSLLEKERLLINFVQHGIDLWGIVKAGYPGWHAHGGHGHGRKLPIIFSGILLEDSEMSAPTITYPNLNFSEDMQTMYDDGWTGAGVVYAGHIGSEGNEYQDGWGPYEHLPPSQWVSSLGEGYRRCCTSNSWVGQALAARIMGVEDLWNHDAFFDYVDRWMYEDDTEDVNEILSATGWDFTANWQRQGQSWDTFVDDLWDTYRSEISAVPDFNYISTPVKYVLYQNFPNPFNPKTEINYQLPVSTNVNLSVFNAKGQKVLTLESGLKAAGQHRVQWNAHDMPSGVYFYSLKAGSFRDVKKMILLK